MLRSSIPLAFLRCGLLILLVISLTASCTKAAFSLTAASYRLDDLGELPHIADDVAVSLNRNGVVAYWARVGGIVRAMEWKNGAARQIPGLAGYPSSITHALNGRGDAVGWMSSSPNLVDSMAITRGFIQHDGHVEIVAGLGGRNSRVLGANDKGTAVGSSNVPDGARHAFVVKKGRVLDLGTLTSGTSSTAYAINNAGVIVGSATVAGDAAHAVQWRNGRIAELGALAPGFGSSARSVNDRGQIAGFADTPEGIHAFLYTRGVMQDLGTLGGEPSAASGVNNRGEVVGASNLSSTRRHAFLWRQGHMIDLNTVMLKSSKWVLLDAFSINDRGQIACAASRDGGPTHLLLLTPM